jgi:hypothetical protein
MRAFLEFFIPVESGLLQAIEILVQFLQDVLVLLVYSSWELKSVRQFQVNFHVQVGVWIC